jgi:hypothetical protein
LALRHDLLEQAFHLALRERGKPKQASLRRAVSSAYYALFHLLVTDGATVLAPVQPPGLRNLISRAFSHSRMRQVCTGLIRGNSAQTGNKAIPRATRELLQMPLDPSVVVVIQAFIDLQEARHDADYDLSLRWNRLQVLELLKAAQQAFQEWVTIRKTANSAVVLAAMLLQNEWAR